MATIKKFDEFVSESVINGIECVDLGEWSVQFAISVQSG